MGIANEVVSEAEEEEERHEGPISEWGGGEVEAQPRKKSEQHKPSGSPTGLGLALE